MFISNRRNVLLGGAALAAATALPAAAAGEIPFGATSSFEEWLSFLDTANTCSSFMYEGMIDVLKKTKSIVNHNRFMMAPKVEFSDGSFVQAKSYALKIQYNMAFSVDLKNIMGLDAEIELRNMLSEQMNAEIEPVLRQGSYLYTIQDVKLVDPATFMPYIGFKARFGRRAVPVIL